MPCFHTVADLSNAKPDEGYHHLPDVNTFQGLINLLSLCNLVILGNVLDFRTYVAPNQSPGHPADSRQKKLMKTYDRNNIPKEERLSMVYTRGLALEIFQWVRDLCEVRNPDGEVIDITCLYLTQQLASLLRYKDEAQAANVSGERQKIR